MPLIARCPSPRAGDEIRNHGLTRILVGTMQVTRARPNQMHGGRIHKLRSAYKRSEQNLSLEGDANASHASHAIKASLGARLCTRELTWQFCVA